MIAPKMGTPVQSRNSQSQPASTMSSNRELNILMLEDVPADAELVDHELSRSGLRYRFKRVEASDEFLCELAINPPDVVLSDHGLPSFDGFTMLAMVRDRYPDVPFLFVTGSLGEEAAIKAFERGASDCVLKHRLHELGPAVKRALRAAGERGELRHALAERNRLAQELLELQEKLRLFKRTLPICSSCKRVRDHNDDWQELETYFRKHFGLMFSHGICPECEQKYYTGYV